MKSIAPIKPQDRNLALSGQDRENCRFQAVQTLLLEHGKSQRVYLEQVPFPLFLAKQVFTNKDSSQIMNLYRENKFQERCEVEVYHKSMKQNAS